jgi:hypothetical protein
MHIRRFSDIAPSGFPPQKQGMDGAADIYK